MSSEKQEEFVASNGRVFVRSPEHDWAEPDNKNDGSMGWRCKTCRLVIIVEGRAANVGPTSCPACDARKQEEDAVNHPSHYKLGGIEVIDAIEAWELNYHRGNAVKYIARAGKKNAAKEIEDLKKARWYIDREIGRLEKAKTK